MKSAGLYNASLEGSSVDGRNMSRACDDEHDLYESSRDGTFTSPVPMCPTCIYSSKLPLRKIPHGGTQGPIISSLARCRSREI
jgi:hypothetical protein